MLSFTLPVFVLLRLFLQKMTQSSNEYIHKRAKYLMWMEESKKNLVTAVNSDRKKIPWWTPVESGLNEQELTAGTDLTPAWQGCRSTTSMVGGQFLWKDYDFKEEYVHCASKKSGGLRLHVMWTQRGAFPQSAGGGVWTSVTRKPCTQNYLITVHMFIYSTTTSICAFWTVTKWCFIACCIDDANYNCSSTILE